MAVLPNPDATGVRVKQAAVLTASQATAVATDAVLMVGFAQVWFSVQVDVLSTVTELGCAFEARDSPTAAWAPVDMEDLVVATGIATQRQWQGRRDVTAIPVAGRRIFRCPAWVREVRALVWANTGAPGVSSVQIFAIRGV